MIEKVILKNGIRVIAEELPYLRSISIGIWILSGSSSEINSNSGISHFLEHMLFKGTKTRTAKDIAEELDCVGGELQAFTSREFTCYSAKVLDNHLHRALDVLHDMIANSIFSIEEIKKEKGVVLEEISMHEDTPGDLVHDLFANSIWEGHPLGFSILGPEKNIKKFSRENIIDFCNKHYCGNNIIITAAGNLQKTTFFSEIENFFGSLPAGDANPIGSPPEVHTNISINKRELEQIHFCMGTPGLNFTHTKRYDLYLLNSIIGGSMSSRLFQSVREKHGFVYNIYSYQSSYRPAGIFSIYAGTSENNFEKVLEIIIDELHKLKDEQITEKELTNTKEQLKGGITLNLESTESRMGQLAKSEIYFQKQITLDEIFKNIDIVSINDIQNLSQQLFQPQNINMVIIGALEDNMKDKISKIINKGL